MYAKKIIIIGGGFAGINLAKKLMRDPGFQITVVDKNNYNFFPPLLYQVATGFLEVSSISFPFRKFFQGKRNVRFRLGTLEKIVAEEKKILLHDGELQYDYLVLATGTETNYFGKENIRKNALPMKTVNDAIHLRNYMLKQVEKTIIAAEPAKRKKINALAIAGGGPTGVEIAGMIAEMTKSILQKDYPELEGYTTRIFLIDGNTNLLAPMSESARQYTYQQLTAMGVEVKLNTRVKDYTDGWLFFENHEPLKIDTLIWAAGVTGKIFPGIPPESYGRGNRLATDQYNQVKSLPYVYAIGDISLQTNDTSFPAGHPQVAQVAIQQGKNLAANLIALVNRQPLTPFLYHDKGSMAIIGRNKAVADLPKPGLHIRGFAAWFMWLFIHLYSLLHHRNRSKTFYNWMVAYFTKDQSLRLIIEPHANQQP